MEISDIIITKPGGITTAEALAKKIPMVIVKPIPGQEASNTAYLMKKGAAIKCDNPKEINLAIEDLLDDPDKLKQLSECAERISKPNASLDAAKLVLELAGRSRYV
jgi:processive 1,2-diacylglycerol beta-glucosyltransferase